MLFDIENDPYEEVNLASAKRNICLEAVYYLNEWHDRMMATMERDIDPLWTVIKEGGPYHVRGKLEEYCKWLERTDRAWAVKQLKARHSWS